MKIEKEIGDGNDYVYVYYNPNDKKLALLEGKNRWECKIGFSSTDPIERIRDQGIQTAISREPVVGLIVKTCNGYYTESLLHKRLYQYKILTENGGDEWFLTNPEEVENILVNDIIPESNKLVKYCEYNITKTKQLGEMLNLHRKKINLTMDKLSVQVDTTRDTLWRLFNDDAGLAIGTILKVIETLGLEITLKSKLPAAEIKVHTSVRKAR